MIDAARRIVHRHDGVGPQGYADIHECAPDERIIPSHAPDAFAFVLDDLEDL